MSVTEEGGQNGCGAEEEEEKRSGAVAGVAGAAESVEK